MNDYDFCGMVQCLYCKHIWYSTKMPHPIRCPNCKKFLCDNRAKKKAKEIFKEEYPYKHKYMYVWIKR